jgi:hypothetical protein
VHFSISSANLYTGRPQVDHSRLQVSARVPYTLFIASPLALEAALDSLYHGSAGILQLRVVKSKPRQQCSSSPTSYGVAVIFGTNENRNSSVLELLAI